MIILFSQEKKPSFIYIREDNLGISLSNFD